MRGEEIIKKIRTYLILTSLISAVLIATATSAYSKELSILDINAVELGQVDKYAGVSLDSDGTYFYGVYVNESTVYVSRLTPAQAQAGTWPVLCYSPLPPDITQVFDVGVAVTGSYASITYVTSRTADTETVYTIHHHVLALPSCSPVFQLSKNITYPQWWSTYSLITSEVVGDYVLTAYSNGTEVNYYVLDLSSLTEVLRGSKPDSGMPSADSNGTHFILAYTSGPSLSEADIHAEVIRVSDLSTSTVLVTSDPLSSDQVPSVSYGSYAGVKRWFVSYLRDTGTSITLRIALLDGDTLTAVSDVEITSLNFGITPAIASITEDSGVPHTDLYAVVVWSDSHILRYATIDSSGNLTDSGTLTSTAYSYTWLSYDVEDPDGVVLVAGVDELRDLHSVSGLATDFGVQPVPEDLALTVSTVAITTLVLTALIKKRE